MSKDSFVSNNSVKHTKKRTVPFQTIQSGISTQFQCQKTVLFQTIQFSIQKKKEQFHFTQYAV